MESQKKKAGRKPLGARAMTSTEKAQRQRAIVRITSEELAKIGCKPMAVHMPPIYLQAMRSFERGFQAEPNFVDVMMFTSGWICRVIEDFIKAEAEADPSSEMAKIFNSDEWVCRDSIDFNGAAINAKSAIYKFMQEQEKGLTQ